ncbi:MAG: DNA polymerase III subunit delta [Oscillospiraceae bacterium]|nr:DNA polymerase III subunit delta [Oscillospiraceae bacterium]
MSAITEKELRAMVKSKDFTGAYLVCGEDSFRKESAVKLLQGAVSSSSFGTHFFDGKDANLDDIAEAVETVSLTGGGTLVCIRDMPFDKLTDGQVKKLKALPTLVPEESVLIFWQTGELKKTARMRSIIKLFSEKGYVLDCGKMTSGELVRILVKGAKKRGCLMSRECAEYLLQCVGDDLNLLLREIEKLCAYSAGSNPNSANSEGTISTILPEHIDLLCAKTIEATAFDMSRALLGGDMQRAMSFLDTLFAQRAEPIMIMGALNAVFVDLYHVKLAQTARRSTNELALLFPGLYKGREFKLRNAAVRASCVPLPRLRACLRYLHEADKLLKSSPAPPRPLLERTVMSLGLALRVRRG